MTATTTTSPATDATRALVDLRNAHERLKFHARELLETVEATDGLPPHITPSEGLRAVMGTEADDVAREELLAGLRNLLGENIGSLIAPKALKIAEEHLWPKDVAFQRIDDTMVTTVDNGGDGDHA